MAAFAHALSQALLRRDDNDPAKALLALISNPFQKTLQAQSVFASLGTSLGFTAITAVLFSALRPYNQIVYAPKLKHADDKHAPPPVGTGYLAWLKPLWTTKEDDLIQYVGLDATIFLRFTRMCRNIFLALSVVACAILIPINYTNTIDRGKNVPWLFLIEPLNVWQSANWGLVVVAWLMNFIICFFLWWNYRKVVGLRRKYFESEEYQKSLHARTLLVTDVPKKKCSDEGLAAIIDQVAPNASFSRTTIARNVRHLPQLITDYEEAVRKLEKILSRYLKDPDNLPKARPLCSPPKSDPDYQNGQKVDAIEYWNRRVTRLRIQIVEARKGIDRRNPYPYGFASFPDIAEAHAVAYASRKKHPSGSTIKLAPRPTDLIWENLHLTPAKRSWRRFIVNLWIAFLTFIWIAPNAMIAIFLVNLGNLGNVWPAFQNELKAQPQFWSIVQGVASPAITSAIFLVLPIIFRRLSIRAGDQTKTGRERHVMSKLYFFFVFNNLVVFSLFSSIWGIVTSIIKDTSKGTDAWKAIIKSNMANTIFTSLCAISPFWVTWLLQRQLGAAIDLAQLWTLLYSFVVRRVSHPTPREIIELTAPPHFEYASYYNYFLFYATVALCFAGLQPLVLPSAALYFTLDVWLKKYLILYIFVTKTESGGLFWRPLFNRLIFGTILSNLVVFLTIWVRGIGGYVMVGAVAPLPFIMIGFKIFCSRMYDSKLYYYSQNLGSSRKPPTDGMSKNDKLSARFGHPVLYKTLFKPMVHKKAQHKLAEVLNTKPEDESFGHSGYSDSVVKMEPMMAGEPGRPNSDTSALKNFEVVAENNLDFEHFKNRAEFAEDHGGGEIFARPGTPSTMFTSEMGSRPGTPVGGGVRSYSPTQSGSPSGSGYPQYGSNYASPSAAAGSFTTVPLDRGRSPLYSMANESAGSLVRNAAGPGMSTETPTSRGTSPAPPRAPGGLGGGPGGYGPVPQTDEQPEQDPSSYDYFRAPRPRRNL